MSSYLGDAPFTQLPNYLIDRNLSRYLGADGIAVCTVIAKHANRSTGLAYPGQSLIAKLIHRCLRHTRNVLNYLVRIGVLIQDHLGSLRRYRLSATPPPTPAMTFADWKRLPAEQRTPPRRREASRCEDAPTDKATVEVEGAIAPADMVEVEPPATVEVEPPATVEVEVKNTGTAIHLDRHTDTPGPAHGVTPTGTGRHPEQDENKITTHTTKSVCVEQRQEKPQRIAAAPAHANADAQEDAQADADTQEVDPPTQLAASFYRALNRICDGQPARPPNLREIAHARSLLARHGRLALEIVAEVVRRIRSTPGCQTLHLGGAIDMFDRVAAERRRAMNPHAASAHGNAAAQAVQDSRADGKKIEADNARQLRAFEALPLEEQKRRIEAVRAGKQASVGVGLSEVMLRLLAAGSLARESQSGGDGME